MFEMQYYTMYAMCHTISFMILILNTMTRVASPCSVLAHGLCELGVVFEAPEHTLSPFLVHVAAHSVRPKPSRTFCVDVCG